MHCPTAITETLIGNAYWNKAQLCFSFYYCNLISKFQFHPPVQTVFWQNYNMAHQAPSLAAPPTHWHSEINSTKPHTHTSCLHRSVVPGTATHMDAEKNLSIAYWCTEMEEGIGILRCLPCQLRLCWTSRSVEKSTLEMEDNTENRNSNSNFIFRALSWPQTIFANFH